MIKMDISVNDLKGFDFSEKYVTIHEKFFINFRGKQIDFKIIKNDYNQIWIQYKYYAENQVVKNSIPFKNPFEIFNEVEESIVQSDEKLNHKSILIKKLLEDLNPDFDNWNELTKKLSGEVNFIELYPNYESSKFPQNLSKEELSDYLDKFSKYELEKLFKDFSILDFELFYQNLWGEDYEYLIRKAFSINLFGEEYFDSKIFQEINKKRQYEYVNCILKKYFLKVDDDSTISFIRSIVNDDVDNDSRDINRIIFQRKIKEENIDLNDITEEDSKKILDLKNEIYAPDNSKSYFTKVNFNNLDDSLIKSKYLYVLKAISSSSKSPIVLRYKIPKEDRADDSVQTIALNNGHIKYDNSKEYLSEYTVNQLKSVLKKYNLKTGGNKTHLINRIKENLSDDVINKEFTKRYFTLTEKGHKYLNKYYYLAEFYPVLPVNFSLDEFELICNSNPDINPDDIIRCLVKEKWLIWDETLDNEPKMSSNEEKLEKIFEKRKNKDNYYENYYDSIILP